MPCERGTYDEFEANCRLVAAYNALNRVGDLEQSEIAKRLSISTRALQSALHGQTEPKLSLVLAIEN